MGQKSVFRHEKPTVKRWHLLLRTKSWWLIPASLFVFQLLKDLVPFSDKSQITTLNLAVYVGLAYSGVRDLLKVVRPKKIRIKGCSALEAVMRRIEAPPGYRRLDGGRYVCAFARSEDDPQRIRSGAASVVSDEITRALWKVRFEFPGKDRRPQAGGLPLHVERAGARLAFNRKWQPPDIAELLFFPLVPQLLKRNTGLTNGSKVRLREDPALVGGELRIKVEKTDYLADIVTAQVSGSVITDHRGSIIYNGYDFFMGLDGVLLACGESSCSNQIGGSVLLFLLERGNDQAVTSAEVVITGQATGNLQSPGLLAPSGSGSFDWEDFTGDRGEDMHGVAYAMLRELFQETSGRELSSLEIGELGIELLLTGYGRMIHRGGKPEFYGIAFLDKRYEERIGIHKSESTYVSGHTLIPVDALNPGAIREQLAEFADKHAEELSHPLWMSVELARSYLAVPENAARFASILTGRRGASA